MDVLMNRRSGSRARRHTLVVTAVWSLALWSNTGCLVDPPQFDEPAIQGDYEDGDKEHRPGQPCTLCHGDGYFPTPPGELELAIGGTVYGNIDDPEDAGLEDVDVVITDASGLEISARSNRTGNFMMAVDGDVSVPTQRKNGWVDIPRALEYPLSVVIRQGAIEQQMTTKIWRNGSCAHCHGPRPGADSVGRVYLFDQVLP